MGEKLGILMVSFFGKSGGAQRTAQLANMLSKGHKVTAILPEYDDAYFDESVDMIKVSAPLGYLKTMLKTIDLTFFINLVRRIDRIHPDVIHITSRHPWSPLLLLFLRGKYPVVTTIYEPEPYIGEKIRFVQCLSNKALVALSNKIIVLGEKLKEDLIKNGVPEEKIKVTSHGGLPIFLKGKKGDIKEEKNTILFFGRIQPYKGLDYLIKAAEILKEKLHNFKIIVAGKGNIGRYKALIKMKNLTDTFELINEYIPNESVAELFQRSSLVVLPYIEGGQSGVMHIAYMFKKPVVTTNVGSTPEVVEEGKTGFVVPPRDVNALADAIIKLLKDDELRKEMGENAYKKMEEELSWDKIAEKAIEIYEKAIASHKKVII